MIQHPSACYRLDRMNWTPSVESSSQLKAKNSTLITFQIVILRGGGAGGFGTFRGEVGTDIPKLRGSVNMHILIFETDP